MIITSNLFTMVYDSCQGLGSRFLQECSHIKLIIPTRLCLSCPCRESLPWQKSADRSIEGCDACKIVIDWRDPHPSGL